MCMFYEENYRTMENALKDGLSKRRIPTGQEIRMIECSIPSRLIYKLYAITAREPD